MQELEKTLLKETEQLVNMHYEDDSVKTIILRNLRDIRKHMSGKDTGVPTNDGWIPVEEYGLPKDEGVYDLTIIDGLGVYDSVRWQFLGGTHLSGKQHYVDGVHYFADNYRGDPINKFLSERVIAWRKKPEPYRSANKTEASGWREDMLRKFDRRD